MEILYEDNHLVAVFKPAGVLTQGDETGDISLMDEVKKYLKEKYHKPGNVFLGLLHRLDRPVSGIVLFAKTSKGASRLSEQFRKRTIEKTYQAIVLGQMRQKEGVLVNYLLKDEENKRTRDQEGGQKAELFFEVLKSGNKYSLLELKPETGRFHQIRAQLALAGCPILGDIKYGAPSALPDKSIALCATSLFFKLATKDETKEISIPLPADWEKILKQ
jgi:23S rRNA pseudouridine1911/1915/1917 synthase